MLAELSDDDRLIPLELSDPHILLTTLKQLHQSVSAEGQATFDRWRSRIRRPDFLTSALNLAYYLALRRQDLRPLQAALAPWGLSSLGRIEARVMPNLEAVIATLEAICQPGQPPSVQRPPLQAFFEGTQLLQRHTEELFGAILNHRRVRILVTLPSEAARDDSLVKSLLQRGADCVRINCAHDRPEDWAAMIHHVRQAEAETGKRCKVLMDLGGPKPRTGRVVSPGDRLRVHQGDYILLAQELPESGFQAPPPPASSQVAAKMQIWQTGCTIPEILEQLEIGAAVWIDDGKIGCRMVARLDPNITDGAIAVWLQVTHSHPKGVKLRSAKGLNFPDTVLHLCPLTAKDGQDLDFVAHHADIIGYSFVQTADDISLLQQELGKRLGDGASVPAIVAKIETPEAVRNLPDLIVQAAGQQALGVMIARGDLAVEIGYQRLAEIQEEILWICEAAHVPVIWATQVLEGLVKSGSPSRGEITDAAMSERAECVMLNKGPFIAEAVTILDDVLTRMEAHQLKKSPQLRALHSW